MGGSGGAVDVVSWFLLPAATLVLWGVRVVGSLRRRDAAYGLMPLLGAGVLALVLLLLSFVLPLPSTTFGAGVDAGDVASVNALATLVLVLALGVLELPLWGVRSFAAGLRGRRGRAAAAGAEPARVPASSRLAGSSSAGIPGVVLPATPAPAAMRPDEAA